MCIITNVVGDYLFSINIWCAHVEVKIRENGRFTIVSLSLHFHESDILSSQNLVWEIALSEIMWTLDAEVVYVTIQNVTSKQYLTFQNDTISKVVTSWAV